MATLGDPLADLGLHLVYSDPAFAPVLAGSAASTSDRLPPAADLAERYAHTSGRELAHLDFYLGLGYFKIAVIAEGIHARHLQGMTRGTGFDHVGDAVAPLAAAGLRALLTGLWAARAPSPLLDAEPGVYRERHTGDVSAVVADEVEDRVADVDRLDQVNRHQVGQDRGGGAVPANWRSCA
jgi:hypothetical protein